MVFKTQNAFMGGEVSPAMYGRFDDKKYQQGLSLCKNFIVRPQGPLHNRNGFEFVRETKSQDKPVRLIPFQYTNEQTIVVEMGERYARFHTQGKTLVTEKVVNGVPTLVPYEVETDYLASDLFKINFVQSGDVLTLVHPNYKPKELRRLGATNWELRDISFAPSLRPPTGLQGYFKIVNKPNYNLTDDEKFRYTYKYKVTAVRATRGHAISDNAESGPSESVSVKGNMYLENATVTITWSAVDGAERYRIYRSYKGLYSYIGESTTPSFTDDNYKVDQEWTPPMYDDPFSQAKGIKSVTVIDGGSGYLQGAVQVGGMNRTLKLDEQYALSLLKQDRLDSVMSTKDALCFVSIVTWENFSSVPDSYVLKDVVLEDVPIIDLGGIGTGGKVRMRFKQAIKSYGFGYSQGDHEHYARREKIYSVLYGIEVISPGSGYVEPVISPKAFGTSDNSTDFNRRELGSGRFNFGYRWQRYDNINMPMKRWELGIFSDNQFRLQVTDDTGVSAELYAIPNARGVIESVTVRYGGRGYSNPTLRLPTTNGGREATFSVQLADVGDYPTAVAYFEQRRVFAGTRGNPQTLWMTRTGTESDMTYTLPLKDDSRIKFRIASQEASRIQHVVPLSNLIIITGGTEFRATSVNSDAITPTSFAVKPQSYIGASHVQPVIVNSAIVYAASRGGHVRELGYSKQYEGYATGDLSLRASHLFDDAEITSMALQKSPDNIVWATQSNGRLLGFTYLPDQGIGGWHWHETPNGKFENVTCVAEGTNDSVYAVVRRTIDGEEKRYIERMVTRNTKDPQYAFYLDCGATYRGEPRDKFTVDWLDGETVTVIADGAQLPPMKVTERQIVLPAPATVVHIGLPYESELRTLPAVFETQDGSFGLASRKNVGDVYVNVFNSSGFFAGSEHGELVEFKPRDSQPYGTPPGLHTKRINLAIPTGWGEDGIVRIVQRNPLPLEITSITWRFMG